MNDLDGLRRDVLDRMWQFGEYGKDDPEDAQAVEALIHAVRADERARLQAAITTRLEEAKGTHPSGAKYIGTPREK